MSTACNRTIYRHLLPCLIGLCIALSSACSIAGDVQAFKELLEMSLKEKKGLTFYVNGQTIAGGVIRFIGEDAVEVKNREFGRIIIRLDRIDAVAMN
jgi:hypothetical protein